MGKPSAALKKLLFNISNACQPATQPAICWNCLQSPDGRRRHTRVLSKCRAECWETFYRRHQLVARYACICVCMCVFVNGKQLRQSNAICLQYCNRISAIINTISVMLLSHAMQLSCESFSKHFGSISYEHEQAEHLCIT